MLIFRQERLGDVRMMRVAAMVLQDASVQSVAERTGFREAKGVMAEILGRADG